MQLHEHAPLTPRQRLRRRVRLIVTGFAVCALMIGALGVQQVRLERELDRVQQAAQAEVDASEREVAGLERQIEERAPIDVEKVAAKAASSVFAIQAGSRGGSGFAVLRTPDDSTLVATNYHVVAEALERLDGRVTLVSRAGRVPGRVWAQDPKTDLALVKISSDRWPRLSDAWTRDRRPRVGDEVVAYGAPLGIRDVATSGVIARLGGDAILSDVSVNPGNSGGPLLSRNGDVVGIVSANLAAPGGSGLAVAVSYPYVCALARDTSSGVQGCDDVPRP